MNPEIQAIERQRRQEQATRTRENFAVFQHSIEPYKQKAVETLKVFMPIAQEAQKLASEAASIQNPPQSIDGLIKDIFNMSQSVPQRINSALAEIDSLTMHDFDFDADHESKYREGEARLNRLIFNLNPGDVRRSLETTAAKLREELAWLAKNIGADSLTTIPATPAQTGNRKVVVNSSYSPLKK